MAIVSYSPIEPNYPDDLLIEILMESSQIKDGVCPYSPEKTQNHEICKEYRKVVDILRGFVEL